MKQKFSSKRKEISYGNDNSERNDERLNGGTAAARKWNYGKREQAGEGRQDRRRGAGQTLRSKNHQLNSGGFSHISSIDIT